MELIRASDCVVCLQSTFWDVRHFHTRVEKRAREGKSVLYNAMMVLSILAYQFCGMVIAYCECNNTRSVINWPGELLAIMNSCLKRLL